MRIHSRMDDSLTAGQIYLGLQMRQREPEPKNEMKEFL